MYSGDEFYDDDITSGLGDQLNNTPCLVCDSPDHSAQECPHGDGCDDGCHE